MFVSPKASVIIIWNMTLWSIKYPFPISNTSLSIVTKSVPDSQTLNRECWTTCGRCGRCGDSLWSNQPFLWLFMKQSTYPENHPNYSRVKNNCERCDKWGHLFKMKEELRTDCRASLCCEHNYQSRFQKTYCCDTKTEIAFVCGKQIVICWLV